MKNIVIALVFAASSFHLNAQELKISTLEVTGNAMISVMPDEVIFSVTVNQQHDDFGVALDELNTKVNTIKSRLKKSGVENNNIRTTNYSINENWKYENGKRYQDGYKAMHSINVHLPFEKEQMKKVYGAIRDSKVEVNMRLSFGLSDRKKYEAELMQNAVVDAQTKAKLIAGAANMRVSGISKITYGGRVNHYQPRNYNLQMDGAMAKSASNIDVTPGAIQLSDQIFIVFEIEPAN